MQNASASLLRIVRFKVLLYCATAVNRIDVNGRRAKVKRLESLASYSGWVRLLGVPRYREEPRDF